MLRKVEPVSDQASDGFTSAGIRQKSPGLSSELCLPSVTITQPLMTPMIRALSRFKSMEPEDSKRKFTTSNKGHLTKGHPVNGSASEAGNRISWGSKSSKSMLARD